jgi:hypothetical protein
MKPSGGSHLHKFTEYRIKLNGNMFYIAIMLGLFQRSKSTDSSADSNHHFSIMPFFRANKVKNHHPYHHYHRIHHYNEVAKKTEAGNNKIGFDDVFYVIQKIGMYQDPKKCPYLMINTLSLIEQDYLIKNTLSYQIEEELVNDLINDASLNLDNYVIVIYGENCVDDSVDKKYKQFLALGFRHVFIYYGGLFEWLMLQEIYGEERFPTQGEKRRDMICLAATPKFMATYGPESPP